MFNPKTRVFDMRMHFIGLMIITFMANIPQIAAEPAGHEHHEDASMLSTPAEGERWATDGPLRQGMNGIRNAVQERAHAFHQGRLTDEEAKSLANEIDTHVGYMIENCELEPEADATLHALLAEVLEGKRNLTANKDEGLPRIVKALAKYPRYFNHPDWEPLDGS